MSESLKTDKQAYALSAFLQFDDLQRKNELCDFNIKTSSEEIHVHKCIVAGASDYFRAMFSHDTLETQLGFVEMKDVDPEAVKLCIDYMYNRDIQIATEKCGKLMHVAHMFQLQALCNDIALFYSERLDAKSFFDAKKIANLYNSETLEEKCDQFAQIYFKLISEESEFLHLDEKYLSFLLKSKDTEASEGMKLRALIAWVKFDAENRTKYVQQKMEQLDLLSIPLRYRRHLVENQPLISGNNDCLKMVTLSIVDSIKVTAEDITVLEHEPQSIFTFDRTSMHLQCYDIEKKSWRQAQPLTKPFEGQRFSAVAVGNRIYAFMRDRSIHCLEFSDESADWTHAGEFFEDHGACPPVAELEGCIYIVGGWGGVESKSVEMYDPSSSKVTRIKDKNISCSWVSVAALDGLLYAVGGATGNKSPNKVESFDPKTQTWSPVASLNIARESPAVTAFKERLFVAGGFDGGEIASVEFFCPKNNIWTTVAPMKVARDEFKVFAYKSYLLAVGGRGNKNSIEKYDAEKDQWEIIETWADIKIERLASIAI